MIEKHQDMVLEGKSIRVSIRFLREYQTKTFERDLNKFLSVQLSKIYSGGYNEFKKKLNVRNRQMSGEEYKKFQKNERDVSQFKYYKMIDYKLVMRKKKPTFGQFVEVISNMFFKYLLRLVSDFAKRPEVTRNFQIVFYVFDGNKRQFIGGHQDPYFPDIRRIETSTIGLIVYSVNGTFLLYRIFAPLYYMGRFEASVIMKFLNHEFEHYIDFIRGNYGREKEAANKVKRYDLIVILNELFWDMMNDGNAEFCERPYQQRILLRGMSELKTFKSKILDLVKMNIKEAEEFYENEINIMERKYYWARIMVFTIALYYIVKNVKQSYFTFYKGRKPIYLGVREMKYKFRKYWKSSKPILMNNIDINSFLWVKGGFMRWVKAEGKWQKVPSENLIRKSKFGDFIKSYEEACNYFSIKRKYRILNVKFIREVMKNAVKTHENMIKADIKQVENIWGFS